MTRFFPRAKAVSVRKFLRIALSAAALFVVGCERTGAPEAGSAASSATSAPARATIRSPDELHAALKAKNPNYNGQAQMGWNGESLLAVDLRGTGVTDLSPLAGVPLVEFYAEETSITDLSPLKGMRLQKISLSDTPVADLTPLRGMPLDEVRLVNTKVADLSPLRGAPLNGLWISRTQVRDLSPLIGSPIVSLTIEGTPVSDLAPVRRMELLERLHLGETQVDDLSAVQDLPLTRLIFTPSRITKGINAARSLPRCREFGVRYEGQGDLMPPQAFWAAYDAGTFR